jgi:hypothetical protein
MSMSSSCCTKMKIDIDMDMDTGRDVVTDIKDSDVGYRISVYSLIRYPKYCNVGLRRLQCSVVKTSLYAVVTHCYK